MQFSKMVSEMIQDTQLRLQSIFSKSSFQKWFRNGLGRLVNALEHLFQKIGSKSTQFSKWPQNWFTRVLCLTKIFQKFTFFLSLMPIFFKFTLFLSLTEIGYKFTLLLSLTAKSPPPPRTDVLSKIPKPSRRSWGGGGTGGFKKFPPYWGFFPLSIFFHISCCLFALYVPTAHWSGAVEYMFCFVQGSPPSMHLFAEFCSVLSVGHQCVHVATYTRRHWVRPLAVLCTLVVSALRVWGALHWVPSGGSPDLASVLWRGEDFAIRQFSTHLSCFYPLRQFSIHLTCFYLLRQFSIRFYPLRQFSTHLSCFYPLRQFSINLSCFYLFQ